MANYDNIVDRLRMRGTIANYYNVVDLIDEYIDQLVNERNTYKAAFETIASQIEIATRFAEAHEQRTKSQRVLFDNQDRAAASAQVFTLKRLSDVLLDIESEI